MGRGRRGPRPHPAGSVTHSPESQLFELRAGPGGPTPPAGNPSFLVGEASEGAVEAPSETIMRVIAGALKGRRLVTPRGATTRPTADQVRIALMDALGPWLPDSRVLDLFAGAGGVGLEALSRGAASATFVERDARAVAALVENIRSLDVESRTHVVRGDVGRQLARLEAEGRRFEIVFLDPPYATDVGERALQALGTGELTAPEGLVVAQHLTKRRPAREYGVLRAFRDRRFGETTLTFFRAGG